MYDVTMIQVAPQLTAVVRSRVPRGELPRAVPAACGEVWNYMRSAQLPKPGRNVALYLDGQVTFEAGAEVAAPFPESSRVVCSRLPGGPVATVTHFGGYDKLGAAYAAIHAWLRDQGRGPAGPCWEVYGHWSDDPAQVRTDVFFLLSPECAGAIPAPDA